MHSITETDLILNPDGSVYHLNLLPEHISNTIITVGDPSRVHSVSKHFDEVDFEMNKREFITHKGLYKGKPITVISTGMGTDNIEIFLTELDALVNIDLKTRVPKKKKTKLKIIRIGTSGAIQPSIPLNTHLVSDYAIGMDNLMNFYKFPQTKAEQKIVEELRISTNLLCPPYIARGSQALLKKISHDMVVGNTVTCPGFYAPQGRQIRLPIQYPNLFNELTHFHHGDFWLTNFEMETATYYALGKLLGHQILSVNAMIANRANNKFSKNPRKTIDQLIVKVLDRV